MAARAAVAALLVVVARSRTITFEVRDQNHGVFDVTLDSDDAIASGRAAAAALVAGGESFMDCSLAASPGSWTAHI